MNEEHRKRTEAVEVEQPENVEIIDPVIATGSIEPFVIMSDDLDDYLSRIDKRTAVIDKLTEIALKKTNKHCWNDMGAFPYLNIAGGERVARIFMVRIEGMTSEKRWAEDENGRYYMYSFRAKFSLPGMLDSTWEVGTCSQRDQFFGKRKIPKLDEDGKQMRNEDKSVMLEEIILPMTDIDEGTIMKAAWTNCKIRGIRSLVGLQGVTWEELERVAGIKRADIKSIQFAAKKKGGQSYPASDSQKRLIHARCANGKIDEKRLCERMEIKSVDEMLSTHINEALRVIEEWTAQDAQATSAEGIISKEQAEYLREGMHGSISEEQFVKTFGKRPEEISSKQFEPAKRWINDRLDSAKK